MDEYLTAKCLTDFHTFLRYGVYFHAWAHYDAPLFQQMSDFLGTWRREVEGQVSTVSVKFLIVAREHCKSQMAIAWDAWQFARDPSQSLLVRAYSDNKAQELLAGLKELLLSPAYQRRFLHVRPQTKPNSTSYQLWRDDRIRLERPDAGVRVPSVEAVGLATDPTGGHFDVGHYDDFEVLANSQTESARKKTLEVWRNDDNLFLAGNQRVVCATPWHKDGIVRQVQYRRGELADHDYDVMVVPAELPILPATMKGHEPVLLPDRTTVRDSTADFPHGACDLALCQARLRFYSPAAHDVVEEIREVTWNDATHFRVSRPIPELLGQPISYVIGREKPAAPNRFTLDAVDLTPPGVARGEALVRASLVGKRRKQGRFIYTMQNLLGQHDPEDLVLNPALIDEVETLPEGPKLWYRAIDFASNKKTKASTSMMTGCWMPGAFYITHILYENRLGNTGKLLEMFLGVLRVRSHGGELTCTFHEEGHIESTLGEEYQLAAKDPHLYFASRANVVPFPGIRRTVQDYLDEELPSDANIRILTRSIPRNQKMSKGLRIQTQQPKWDGRQVKILAGCPHKDDLFEQAENFRVESGDPFDLLDNLADLLMEGRAPTPARGGLTQREGMYAQKNREALLRQNDGIPAGLQIF